MTTFTVEPTSTVLELHQTLPPGELAAAAFLARYRGRTLESYRHDLRSFFAWADEVGLRYFPQLGRSWSYTSATWRRPAWRRPPSTDECPPSAGSTASPTSTA